MKNDKAAMPKSNEKQRSPKNNPKNKNRIVNSDPGSTPTEKTKARAGRGLANEGTVVSYEEER